MPAPLEVRAPLIDELPEALAALTPTSPSKRKLEFEGAPVAEALPPSLARELSETYHAAAPALGGSPEHSPVQPQPPAEAASAPEAKSEEGALAPAPGEEVAVMAAEKLLSAPTPAAQHVRRESSASLPLVYRPARASVQAAREVMGGSIVISVGLSTRDARRARGKPKYAKQLTLPPYEQPQIASNWRLVCAPPPPAPPPLLLLTPPPVGLAGRISAQGWLRERVGSKKWRWRWCALVAGQLRCFVNLDEFFVGAHPVSRLELAGSLVHAASIEQPLQMELSVPRSVGGIACHVELAFAAPTREARSRWARALLVASRAKVTMASPPMRGLSGIALLPAEEDAFDGFEDADADEWGPIPKSPFSPLFKSTSKVVRVVAANGAAPSRTLGRIRAVADDSQARLQAVSPTASPPAPALTV